MQCFNVLKSQSWIVPLILTTSLSSCFLIKTDGQLVKESIAVEHPLTGHFEKGAIGTGRDGAEIFSLGSFSKNGEICFQGQKSIDSRASAYGAGVNLDKSYYYASGYMTAEDFDKEDSTKDFGVPAKSIAVIDKSQSSHMEASTEKTEYKDSSGKIIATAERPTQKQVITEVTTYQVCFPAAKVLNQKTKFLALKRTLPTLTGGKAAGVVAAWQFR
ncbi:MAG: hypothetical protein NT027_20205 [Proteobacteria bacterium]|nr:hypothetical protein [Pseudomonadota bacterium]